MNKLTYEEWKEKNKDAVRVNKPEPPKSRMVCDVCGDLGEQGKHTSFMCKFFNLLGSLTK